MAIHFKETEKTFGAIQSMLEHEEKIAAQIQTHNVSDANAVLKLRDELKHSWKDFSNEERKLNIAVVGRVKAGKSTFLNTIIFGGKHILPEAFTPKTATLTKIEYAKENSLEVEYYSGDDWKTITELAKSSVESDETKAAKELVQAVRNKNVEPAEVTARKRDIEKFTSDDELAGRLNRYVGEDGELTPLVKCVTLRINKPELEGISIVDTPGLNDPVISRTQQTREFLALCDVVFFLSPASQFLDQSDVRLLKAQLPQKGVARLILICSRFDDGLVDVIYDVDSLQAALIEIKNDLKKRAVKIFSKHIEACEEDGNTELAKILSECLEPLFVSSILRNMIGKDCADYNEIEANVFENLNEYGDLNSQMIATIGDVSPVNDRLQEIIKQKDFVLAQKAKSFVPLAERNLRDCLNNFKTSAQHKYNQLANNDKAALERQQKAVAARIHTIQGSLEEYFGDIYAKIERLKLDILKDLRQSSRDYSTLQVRTGYEEKVISFRVSDSKWYNPFTWGRSHREYHSYQTRYTYIDTNDALENIRNYARDSASAIESGFSNAAELSNLKRRLLNLILNNFDSAADNFDPAYFRLVTERTLNKIDLPVIKIDVSDYLNSVSSKFSGELRDSGARSQIQSLLPTILAKLFDSINDTFTAEISSFKRQMDSIKDNFTEHLLTDINKEFDELKVAWADKDKNIKALQDYLDALKKLSAM
jgi:predicted GTPase